MNIYEVLKIMSSENKAKIISKLIFCSNCQMNTVNVICDEICLKQSNFSKHLMELKQKGIVIPNKNGREVFYCINDKFEKQWGDLITEIINKSDILENHHCGCCKTKNIINKK